MKKNAGFWLIACLFLCLFSLNAYGASINWESVKSVSSSNYQIESPYSFSTCVLEPGNSLRPEKCSVYFLATNNQADFTASSDSFDFSFSKLAENLSLSYFTSTKLVTETKCINQTFKEATFLSKASATDVKRMVSIYAGLKPVLQSSCKTSTLREFEGEKAFPANYVFKRGEVLPMKATFYRQKGQSLDYNLTLGTTKLDPAVSCGVISSSGLYWLTADQEGNPSCFNITASDVIFDCAGSGTQYPINYSRDVGGYGIYSENTNNVTIQNCVISTLWGNKTGQGIYFVNTNNSVIKNTRLNILKVTGTAQVNYGILFNGASTFGVYPWSRNMTVFNVTCFSNTVGSCIYIDSIVNVTINYSTIITTTSSGSIGMTMSYPFNSTIENSYFLKTSANVHTGYGIYFDNAYYTYLNNVTSETTQTNSVPIYYAGGDYPNEPSLIGNNVNLSTQAGGALYLSLANGFDFNNLNATTNPANRVTSGIVSVFDTVKGSFNNTIIAGNASYAVDAEVSSSINFTNTNTTNLGTNGFVNSDALYIYNVDHLIYKNGKIGITNAGYIMEWWEDVITNLFDSPIAYLNVSNTNSKFLYCDFLDFNYPNNDYLLNISGLNKSRIGGECDKLTIQWYAQGNVTWSNGTQAGGAFVNASNNGTEYYYLGQTNALGLTNWLVVNDTKYYPTAYVQLYNFTANLSTSINWTNNQILNESKTIVIQLLALGCAECICPIETKRNILLSSNPFAAQSEIVYILIGLLIGFVIGQGLGLIEKRKVS